MAKKLDDALQFDGTFGSAKTICEWVGAEGRAVCGANPDAEDHHEGGLNLVTTGKDGETVYETVEKGDWIVHRDGSYARLSDEQYKFFS